MIHDLVSIILPVYNAEKTLEESVFSVLDQTWTNWELIFVDDKSGDNSRELIQKFASKDDRIRSIFLEANLGAAGARNAGVAVAQGRFIAFIDSDDLWMKHKLTRQISLMEETGADISFTDYEWINLVGKRLDVVVKASNTPTWEDLTWGNDIGLSTAVVDRTRVGDPIMPLYRLNHDYAMWLEYLRKGARAVRVPELLVQYRVISGSLSHNKFESFRLNWVILSRMQHLSVIAIVPRLLWWAFRTSFRRVPLWLRRK